MKLAINLDDTVKDYYVKYNKNTDSGFDLHAPEKLIIPPHTTVKLNHKVRCEVIGEPQGYYLIPRSSISKTPLICHNSIGVIDFTYRGDIIGAIYNGGNEEYVIEQGTRLFQLCSPDLKPLDIEFVDKLSETERGSGGFGSTGH